MIPLLNFWFLLSWLLTFFCVRRSHFSDKCAHYHKRTLEMRLPDAGVERLGYGEVMLKIEVVPRRQ